MGAAVLADGPPVTSAGWYIVSRLAFRSAVAVFSVSLLTACDDGTGPDPEPSLRFGEESMSLGLARSAVVVIHNNGSSAASAIQIVVGPVRKAGVEVPGVSVAAVPDEIGMLEPGDSASIQITVSGAGSLQAGTYQSELQASAAGTSRASAMVAFQVPTPADEVGAVEIVGAPATWRQGDVLSLDAVVYDTLGAVLGDADVTWSIDPTGRGAFSPQGEFVPYTPGPVSIIATAGTRADTAAVTVEERGLSSTFSVIGSSPPPRGLTSDLWVHGEIAYTGAYGGDRLYAWDISGATPLVTDSVQVPATNVNDVKISADGTFAVMTQEGGGGAQAITLLDMTDPQHPTIAGVYTSDIGGPGTGWQGVHNAWIEGNYVYLAVDGSGTTRGLWIIDVSDLANPVRVARFYGGSSDLHDVYVRDGLAFLSHWDAGLIILDVGNGISGGSPTNPVEVARIAGLGGQTHNAWYWPETGYVFVGEEDFGTPGYMHVVDASDLLNPIEVASYRVAGDAPHNFWLDEDRGILYMAWYSQGLHAIDVSGQLVGSLELQGRLIAQSIYDGGSTDTWAPQLHDGYVFVSDINSGIWKLQPNF